jgi:ATP-dependent Clp protease ATP-binding subunit ClpA
MFADPVRWIAGTRELRVLEDLRRTFRPEFLNRVDQTIVYRPLTLKAVEQIVDLQMDEVRERLQKQHITVSLSAGARKRIAELGFNPEYGARAIRRVIQDHIENPLAGLLLSGKVKAGQSVNVGLHQGELTLSPIAAKAKLKHAA